jgi:hypothetical protein
MVEFLLWLRADFFSFLSALIMFLSIFSTSFSFLNISLLINGSLRTVDCLVAMACLLLSLPISEILLDFLRLDFSGRAD